MKQINKTQLDYYLTTDKRELPLFIEPKGRTLWIYAESDRVDSGITRALMRGKYEWQTGNIVSQVKQKIQQELEYWQCHNSAKSMMNRMYKAKYSCGDLY